MGTIRKQKLFIGNGPNRLRGDRHSWAKLMKDLRAEVGLSRPIASDAPFSLEYEGILQAAVAGGRDEGDLAASVGRFAKRILATPLHEELVSLGFSEVLTTNYDFSLELAAGAEPSELKNVGRVRERRYSLFRHFRWNDTRFWHIHGDASTTRSITLGLDHYAGHLQRLRNYMVDGLTYEGRSFPRLLKRLREGSVGPIEVWADLFFSPGDLHIVGFSLDFTEVHLWWLLAYRARLIQISEVEVPNRVFFHTLETGSSIDDSRNRVLESQGVEVKVHGDDSDFRGHYEKVVRWLRRNA